VFVLPDKGGSWQLGGSAVSTVRFAVWSAMGAVISVLVWPLRVSLRVHIACLECSLDHCSPHGMSQGSTWAWHSRYVLHAGGFLARRCCHLELSCVMFAVGVANTFAEYEGSSLSPYMGCRNLCDRGADWGTVALEVHHWAGALDYTKLLLLCM